jgi:membrane protease YdiL (CAAX protease family)
MKKSGAGNRVNQIMHSRGYDGELPERTCARPISRVQAIELLVFLFLIAPYMALSFFILKQSNLKFELMAATTISRDLAMMCLIFFFLWRNRESVEDIGWTSRHAGREIAVGLLLFVPLFVGAGLLGSVLGKLGFSLPRRPAALLTTGGGPQILLGTVLVTVVAVAEETIFRGYLILRIRTLASSVPIAVLLSSAIFALGHGYEGSAGVITVGCIGLILALIYIWRQSLIAPAVMHFLQDFIGIILIQ